MLSKLFLIILFCFQINASAQFECYIAISSKDCGVCQLSYTFINKIDNTLNPVVVLAKSDSAIAEYYVREYLDVKKFKLVIDDLLFYKLTSGPFNHQIELFYNKQKIFNLPVKELSSRINELNSYVTYPERFDMKTEPFSQNQLNAFNSDIRNKFFVDFRRTIWKENLVLYSDVTRWLSCLNLGNGTFVSLRMTDSILMDAAYGFEGLSKVKVQRDFYIENIPGLTESKINSFCFADGKLYLDYRVLDYQNMKSEKEILSSGNEAVLIYRNILAEADINTGGFRVIRSMDISDDYFNYRIGFSQVGGMPAWVYKKESNENEDSFYYLGLTKEWKLKSFNQKRPELLSKYLIENLFIDEFTYNYDQYILINNHTGKYVKIHPGHMSLNGLLTGGSLFVDSQFIYFNALRRSTKDHYIHRLNISNAKLEVLKTLKEQDDFSFYPVFYHDISSGKLFVLDISNKKELVIVDQITLSE